MPQALSRHRHPLPAVNQSPPSTCLPGATAHSCLACVALAISPAFLEASMVYDPPTPFCAPPAPTSPTVMPTSRCAFIGALQSPATLPSTAGARASHWWPQDPNIPSQHAPSFGLCMPEPNLNQAQLIPGAGADLQCLGTSLSSVSFQNWGKTGQVPHEPSAPSAARF